MKRWIVAALLLAAYPAGALAWGNSGHLIVNGVAARALPATLPAFVRTPEAIATIEYLGPEEDRLKGAGASWDRDDDPGHFVDVGDDGTVAGVVRMNALPGDLAAYDKALEGAGTSQYRAGYLPYAIADGWEQVRKDFAMWRAFAYLAEHAQSPEARAVYARYRNERESLAIHDIGIWGHFVGDGSQPLHVSVHFNGWGDYPNPNGYTQEHIHSPFEGAFVRDHVTAEAVAKLVAAAAPDAAPTHLISQEELMASIGTYLTTTAAAVPKLYDIAKVHGFENASPQAISFATARVAAGAIELRDLIELAWTNSAYAKVGYPEIPLGDILDGTATPNPSAFGGD